MMMLITSMLVKIMVILWTTGNTRNNYNHYDDDDDVDNINASEDYGYIVNNR